jgi:hypothetical protein
MLESLDVSGHGSGMMIDGGGYSMRLSFPVSARLTDDSPILLVPADERDVEPLRRLYRIIVDEGTYYPHDRFPDQDDFLDYWFRSKSTVVAYVPDRARLAWRLCGFVTNSPEYCRLVFSENVVVRGLWNTLGYIELGMIPRAARKNDGTYQDAMIMFRSLLD